MPITITVAEIAAAIRVGSEPEETAEVSRIRDYAVVAIMQYLGDAFDDVEDVVLNMACTLLVGWLYDRPTTTAACGIRQRNQIQAARSERCFLTRFTVLESLAATLYGSHKRPWEPPATLLLMLTLLVPSCVSRLPMVRRRYTNCQRAVVPAY